MIDSYTEFRTVSASLLAGIYDQQPPSWVNKIAADFPTVRDYAERIQQEVGVYAR